MKLEKRIGLVIDMDGVLYRNNLPVEGAGMFLNFLNSEGIPYVLLTNNSTMTAADYRIKLLNMGMDVKEDRIVTSGYATTLYMKRHLEEGPVFVVGERGLMEEVKKLGWSIVSLKGAKEKWREVRHVVVGLDPGLTYEKLKYAVLAIRKGATFIGTNPDTTYPAEDGLYPGAGSIIAAIEAATGRKPIVVGKPNEPVYEIVREKLGHRIQELWMIGDRLDTDVAFAKRVGMKAILVLTGVSTLEDVERSRFKPDLMVPSVKELTGYLKAVLEAC